MLSSRHLVAVLAYLVPTACTENAVDAPDFARLAPAPIDVPSCSRDAVQQAIADAANGDLVRLPAQSSCTWEMPVEIPADKGITLDGAGSTIDGVIHLQQSTSTSTRITGFSFVRPNAIDARGSTTSAPYRIDHNTFTSTVGGKTLLDVGWGNGPGLIDHNTFRCPANCEMIHVWGYGPGDDAGWKDDVVPGSFNAVYVENNTFINNDPSFGGNETAYFWGNSAIQSYYGARTVFRYNHLLMSQVDQHGTAGAIGARWWEIYENTFSTEVPNANQCCYVTLRAGSGVVFGNKHMGVSPGRSIDLYEEDSEPNGPALYKIGRGKDQALDPAYLWDNDPFFSIGSQTPDRVQKDRDYYLGPKPGYTPFRYPYPLTATGLPDPLGQGADTPDIGADGRPGDEAGNDDAVGGGCTSTRRGSLLAFAIGMLIALARRRA